MIFRDDRSLFNNVVEAVKTNYNDRYDEIRKRWGGGIVGPKAQAVKNRIEKLKAKELASKMWSINGFLFNLDNFNNF